MSALRIVAIVLLLGGVLGLVYGKFSYTEKKHDAKLGPIELSVKDKETVHIPDWVSISAIVLGGVLLISTKKR